jgi:hypothetical protein|tara:strand:- start:36 stop:632 length:597 start_codon:yes stop_codon:yes gene_type:complete
MATFANQGVYNQASFGQHGSAYLKTVGNVFIPPVGSVVVAIQCLAASKFDILESEDSNRFFNHVNVAHNIGDLTSAAKCDNSRFLDTDSSVSEDRIGQALHDDQGRFKAIIKGVGFNEAGDEDASFVELDRRVTINSAETLQLVSGEQGRGGEVIDNNSAFPAGITIFGRFNRVSLVTEGEVILYLGPSKDYEKRNPQ